MNPNPTSVVVSDAVMQSLSGYTIRLCREDGMAVVEVPVVRTEIQVQVVVTLHAQPVSAEQLGFVSCGRIQLFRHGVQISDGSAGPDSPLNAPQSTCMTVGVPMDVLPAAVVDRLIPQRKPSVLQRITQRITNWWRNRS